MSLSFGKIFQNLVYLPLKLSLVLSEMCQKNLVHFEMTTYPVQLIFIISVSNW